MGKNSQFAIWIKVHIRFPDVLGHAGYFLNFCMYLVRGEFGCVLVNFLKYYNVSFERVKPTKNLSCFVLVCKTVYIPGNYTHGVRVERGPARRVAMVVSLVMAIVCRAVCSSLAEYS